MPYELHATYRYATNSVEKSGRSFCSEVFSQGMNPNQTKFHTRMVQTIVFGIPKASL
jgi:hypothetical protein